MATKKITQLTAITNPVDSDVFPIHDSATITTKKISWATIKSLLGTYFSSSFTGANAAITGATKTKITYDAKGLVTAGADATTADIASSTDKRYLTDAQLTVVTNTSGSNTGNETAARIGTLISGSSAKDTLVDADLFAASNSASSNVLVKHTWSKLKEGINTAVTTVFKAFTAAAVSTVSSGYASETMLAGSIITIPTAGGWQVGAQYRLIFEMVKTAAGTGAFTIRIRMGTTGTTSDDLVLSLAFGAGSAAADTGLFEVFVTFRTVGSGTSAVIQGVAKCSHHLAATGLISTGASGVGVVLGTSSGFNSSTATKIGVGVVGGTSFSGTCTLVQAELLGLSV
jgi:hypothetical protein